MLLPDLEDTSLSSHNLDCNSSFPFKVSIILWDESPESFMLYFKGKDELHYESLKGSFKKDSLKHTILRILFPDLFVLKRKDFAGLDGSIELDNAIDRDIIVVSIAIPSVDEIWQDILQMLISHESRENIRNTLQVLTLVNALTIPNQRLPVD